MACLCRCQRSPGLLRRVMCVVSCRSVAARAFLGLLNCAVVPGAYLPAMPSYVGLASVASYMGRFRSVYMFKVRIMVHFNI